MHEPTLSFTQIQGKIAANPSSEAPAMQISGTIITFNEEDHIEEVIQSLQKVCD